MKKSSLSLLFLWVLASPLAAQEEWEVACPDCWVSLELVIALGEEDGEGYVGEFGMLRRGSQHYFLRDYVDPERVKVFSLSGEFIRNLGRSGEGPGEFKGGTGIAISPGDSLFVLDPVLNRLSVFGPDFEFARSWQVPLVLEDQALILLPGGRLLLTGFVPTQGMVGIPHHLFDRDGSELAYFGDPRGPYSPGGFQHIRFVTLSDPGKVWVAHHEEHRLTQWSLTGDRLKVLRPIRPWFEEPKTENRRRGRDGIMPPRSGMIDISEDHDGLLWTIGRGPAIGWRESLGPDGRRGDLEDYFDYWLEVTDPVEGQVVASRRITEGGILGFLDKDHVYGSVYEGMVPKIVIWRIRLRRPQIPGGQPDPTETQNRGFDVETRDRLCAHTGGFARPQHFPLSAGVRGLGVLHLHLPNPSRSTLVHRDPRFLLSGELGSSRDGGRGDLGAALRKSEREIGVQRGEGGNPVQGVRWGVIHRPHPR
ncbi:6-bladed beta-propeller [Gemmatimonadota bacterium]